MTPTQISNCSFTKLSGAGNDFLAIDDRKEAFPTDGALVRRLCHRQHGVGADGVLLLQSDFHMRIFNADGSEAEMCGNGLRCILPFLEHLGFTKSSFTIQTARGPLQVTREGDQVVGELPIPVVHGWGVEVEGHRVDWLDTGVPHLVLFVADVDATPLEEMAPPLREAANANVNIIQAVGSGLRVRTWERGVEGETLACGTGAAAAAWAYIHREKLKKATINLLTRGGTPLEIRVDMDRPALQMVGPADLLFTGKFPCEGWGEVLTSSHVCSQKNSLSPPASL